MTNNTKDHSSTPPSQVTGRTLPRDQYILLLRAALSSDHNRFARDTALNWLGNYPGDLQIGLLYAKALIGEGHQKLAKPILDGLCLSDPEFLEAVETLKDIIKKDSNGYSGSDQSDYQPGGGKTNEKYYTHDAFERSNVVSTWNYALRGPRILNKNNAQAVGYNQIATWGQPLWHARRSIKKGDIEGIEKMILLVIGADPPTPLPQVTHLEYLDSIGNTPLPARLSIAEHYHRKWQHCLPITLLFAKWLMAGGDPDRAVHLLHQAASRDISGQVIERLWGTNHPYASLWPGYLELKITEPIPADVAYILGWNQLPGRDASQTTIQSTAADSPEAIPDFLNDELAAIGLLNSGSDTKDLPNDPKKTVVKKVAEVEVLKSVKDELERLAKSINKPGLTDLDGRFPIYVVFSVRHGLEKKFGKQSTNLIINEMIKLVDHIQNNSTNQKQQVWGARLFMPDDPLTLKPLGMDVVEQNDPWKLKLAIRDLDDILAKRGEMIGALLIVGGPEVVPFHNLPNPVDDPDDFVASDNPYGTKDENYFIPEWSIGRLPGGRGTDPNLLINSLRRIQNYHAADTQKKSWYLRLLFKLIPWIRPDNYSRSKSVGYSAEVWRKASQSVFQPIGEHRDLFTSPPLGINGKVPKAEDIPPLSTARLGYFNLHGLVDSAEWYGQSDPIGAMDEPEYPIALRPQDINLNGHMPQDPSARVTVNDLTATNVPNVVFSEACYGTNVIGKTIEEALSLKFLAAGSSLVVGSTSMSYGSLSTPLIAADLLGHAFWQNLRSGIDAGEALRQAKIQLAQEMHDRQGYLDGEDQKTLISFVYFGDPLAQFKPASSVRKSFTRLTGVNDDLNTVCDRAIEDGNSVEISPSELDRVKQIVVQYLPGMTDAELSCVSERAVCHAEGHVCPTSQFQNKSGAEDMATRKVITLSKQIKKAQLLHNQFARITFDESGKLVKLVVSR